MSHTPKEAAALWCPMVRIAQVGVSETPAAYNRVMVKMHVQAVLRDEDGNEQPEMVVKAHPALPMASRCISNECAMWRWENGRPNAEGMTTGVNGMPVAAVGYCGLAGRVQS